MARLARAAQERARQGPASSPGSSLVAASQHRALSDAASTTSSASRPAAPAASRAARGLAEGAGLNLLARPLRRGRPRSSWTCSRDRASAGRRTLLAPPVHPIELRAARAATPPAAGFRSCRAARSFPAPCSAVGPSSNTMPSAFSSSRMRSAVAKSRFFFASAFGAAQRSAPSTVAAHRRSDPGTTAPPSLAKQARAAAALRRR